MKHYINRGGASRRSLVSLVLLISLFAGLVVPSPLVKASADTGTVQWQDTSVLLDNAQALVCIDGQQANTLLVSARTALKPGMSSGSYSINWKTGNTTILNALPFDSCDNASGFAYLTTGDGSILRLSSLQPQGQKVSHIPKFFAKDGSLQFYATANASPNQPLIIFASSDAGLTWQELPHRFDGKYNQMTVSQTDARVIYVITCPNQYPDNACKLFSSWDAGLSWEDRGYPNVGGVVLTLQNIPGHNTPIDNLLVEEFSTSHRVLKVSGNGGRTFQTVADYIVNDSPHAAGPSASVEIYETNRGLLRRSCDVDSMCKLELSRNTGYTWQPLPALPAPLNQSHQPLMALPNNPDSFLSVDAANNYIWLTKDAGQSWQKIAPSRGNLFITPYAPTMLLNIYQGSTGPVSTLDVSRADQSLTAMLSRGPDSVTLTSHIPARVFGGYWYQKGGLAQFGYATTEQFREANPADGKVYTVQYFERNRFEYHPEKAGTDYQILLGLLGSEQTATRRANGDPAFQRIANPNQPGFLYFDATGHTLAHTFREYWEQHGGLAIYGYPISEEFQELNPDDGQIYTVQYFERNRFEYHPNNKGTPYEVLLGLLGNTLLKQKGWL